MLIEGKNAIREAIENGVTINKIMVDKNIQGRKDEIIALATANKIKFEFVPKLVLDKKSKTTHHQGYIADAVEFSYCNVEDILKKSNDKNEKPFIVLLDGIEDPHNFGAIIRSCECAGVHGIIIPKNRACQVNETVLRTSGENIYSKNLNLPIAVVIGSEGFGTKKSIQDMCDGIITLPLKGKVNSLNASVACGIVVFEILRQRGN